MTVNRRKALSIIGGGTILAATAGVGYLAARSPATAHAPWDLAGQYDDPRKRALSYAILAPNPHNRQPWIVDLSEPDTVILYRDKDRDLPATDPFSRQLTIGLGCFLELMAIAASHEGYSVDQTLFPEGENGPVARAKFREGVKADPLFAHVMDRRSCKEPFEDRAVPTHLVEQLQAYGTVITDQKLVADVRDLTWDAWLVEAGTPEAYKESVDLMRLGAPEIDANPDGIDLGGGMLEIMIAAKLLSREAQVDPTSFSYKEGTRIYREMLAATPAYVTITSQANTRQDQIEAGRKWLRLNLKTTALGLALHPVSQSLQEYAEMAELYAKTHEMLAKPGQTVQMLGRLGFGPTVGPSPRWPLETRIQNG